MYTILHVETSKFYKSILNNICISLGMEYINTPDINEGFRILEKNKISLIITAMELRGGSAKEFINKINKTNSRNIPIVVITGNDSYDDRKSMYDLGIVDYISKQADPEEIKNSIKTYIKDDENIKKMTSLQIAVCDDSMMDRFIIERIFNMYNIHKVDYFESGQSLLDTEKEYDIYIVDLVLEKMSGRNVITQLRQTKKDNVIISISGMDSPKIISNVLTAGADDFVTKPFNNEIFISRLKTHVRNYLLVKKLEEKNKLLKKMSVTDGLTSLYNHKFIIEQVKHEIESVKRYQNELSILMFDIDFFKKINDTYGHQYGDFILKKISEVIKTTARGSDITARYGGEEFMLLMPNTNIDNAVLLAERLRKNVEQMDTGKRDFQVTISIGVCQYNSGDDNTLIKAVDDLLYKAKEGGRNRVERC